MPANEQTWRDQKLMHVVFGVSGLAMLATTVWMLAADHTREWKNYQRKFRDIEAEYSAFGQNEQQNSQFAQREIELNKKLGDEQLRPIAGELVERFKERIVAQQRTTVEDAGAASPDFEPIDRAFREINDAPDDGVRGAARGNLLEQMRFYVADALRQERNADRTRKFRRADLDVANSNFALAVGEGRPPARLDELQAIVKAAEKGVGELTVAYQNLRTYRTELEHIVSEITAGEDATRKALEDHRAELVRLEKAQEEQALSWSNYGEPVTTFPIIDAFNTPLKINQIWLPDLTQPVGSFRPVARFDRCMTCHQAMEKTLAGSSVNPKYPVAVEFNVLLGTPATEPKAEPKPEAGARDDQKLRDLYGLQLADDGVVQAADVTISGVDTGRPAAQAAFPPHDADAHEGLNTADVESGLLAGDVIIEVLGAKITSRAKAVEYLLRRPEWGQPLTVRVRRGMPHPFSSHPRLDLFVGSLSPHKVAEFGCTICHEGQGSATSFAYASHTPDDFDEQDQWTEKNKWFNNHFWIYPMFPTRFAESSCVKCHHGLTELAPSEKFPDPPAAKLLEGHDLVKKNGCFGCHEIAGYDGPEKRIGPDLRSEPPIFAAAQQTLVDPGLTPEERALAERVARHPEYEADRKLLAELIRKSATAEDGSSRLSARTQQMAGLLAADDQPVGTLRKVGPSLRYVASKVGEAFLYDWIRDPKHFRPSTRMPQFFGLHKHLLPNESIVEGHVVEVENLGLKQSQRLEPIEIRALSTYLTTNSQKFEYVGPAGGELSPASVERGKKLFESRGCLACHQHADFPEAAKLAETYHSPLIHAGTQGPELSRLGAKLNGAKGRQWLESWLRQPDHYHTRTVMPNLFLEAYEEGGTRIDPAADIAAFLLSPSDWQPEPMPELIEADLDELALMHLSATFTQRQAERYLAEGVPAATAAEMRGDEALLVAPPSIEKKLAYVGRRTISKYGCTACHDIPGYEDAKPIGTQLQAWGRKETSQLAYEQIEQYLARSLEVHGGPTAHSAGEPHESGAYEKEHAPGEHHLPELKDLDPDTSFFLGAMMGHQREGFLWQKLREPRSYDYRRTENKTYNDRYKMPQFSFTDEEREAVMTFILGLVSEPPPARFIYQPKPRQKAIVEGRRVLEKYNCGSCHTLEMEKWQLEYDPKSDQFASEQAFNDYEFLKTHFTPEQLAASQKVDRRDRGHVELTGTPKLDEEGAGLFEDVDDNDNPLYFFELWRSLPIAGQVWAMGGPEVQVSKPDLQRKRPGLGGYLARWLYPVALAAEKEVNPNAKASDAWGWVPPPLVNEGSKVQTDWLHDFLLEPYAIRPAVVLRMPKFNLTSSEASALVDYFAAVDGVPYPYVYDPRERVENLSEAEAGHPQRLDHALRIVTNGDYCIKCHLLNDFVPAGSVKALAPRLDLVYQRLRPDFVRNWIANPKRLLPYSGMPVNFPPETPVRAELFAGTSQEQLDAVVDLLLTYDDFMKGKTSVKPLIQQPTLPAADSPANEQASAGN